MSVDFGYDGLDIHFTVCIYGLLIPKGRHCYKGNIFSFSVSHLFSVCACVHVHIVTIGKISFSMAKKYSVCTYI